MSSKASSNLKPTSSKPKHAVKPRIKALKRTQSLSFPSSPRHPVGRKQHRDSSFCKLPAAPRCNLDEDLERLSHLVEESFKVRRSRLQVQLRAIGLSLHS